MDVKIKQYGSKLESDNSINNNVNNLEESKKSISKKNSLKDLKVVMPEKSLRDKRRNTVIIFNLYYIIIK